jgi:hypothetical protein
MACDRCLHIRRDCAGCGLCVCECRCDSWEDEDRGEYVFDAAMEPLFTDSDLTQ